MEKKSLIKFCYFQLKIVRNFIKGILFEILIDVEFDEMRDCIDMEKESLFEFY